MDCNKKLVSQSEKYYTDEQDIDFKITFSEHQLLLECLTYCLSCFDFTIPLYQIESYLKEDTLSFKKSDSILNMHERLTHLMRLRTDEKPYERIDEYVDEQGHKSYITVPLNDN